MDALLAGYVTSADTGNEDLVIASRAALTTYCDASQLNLERVCSSLFRNLKAHQGYDRIVVPTLQIIAFLFAVGVYPRASTVDMKSLCLQVQKAGYKTGNVRKLEACVKVYGGVAGLGNEGFATASEALAVRRTEGIGEARKRLGAFMVHPWPRVRTAVVDELWELIAEMDGQGEKLKGVDWGTADKARVKTLVTELGLG